MQYSIVYVVINPAMPGLVKIGKTLQDDASFRLAQLYSTGVPFPFNLEFACRVIDPTAVEQALHTAFGPQRVNPKREFFKIDAGQAIAILKLLHTEDATSEITAQPSPVEAQEVAAGEAFKSRRPNLNFLEMQIPVGSMLQSTAREASVEVSAPRKVRWNGQEMSLTRATREVLGQEYSVAPTPYWTYQGKLLQDIYDETYPAEDE